MAYTPINQNVFIASYAGALAAMAAQGSLFQPLAASYLLESQIAGSFAQSFDTQWNSATALSDLEARAIQSVAQANFTQHAPGPFNQMSYLTPATWNVASLAIKAVVLEALVYFTAQGISPNVTP